MRLEARVLIVEHQSFERLIYLVDLERFRTLLESWTSSMQQLKLKRQALEQDKAAAEALDLEKAKA